MRFSFVIPTYNNKLLLRNTLEALNYQNWPESFEVIIVDDGSTDGTHEYIEGINRRYILRYYYINRDNNSCRAKTRNHGWRKVEGDIIAFIDSDIIVKPDYLHELDRFFSKSDRIFILGNRLMLDKPVCFDDIGSGAVFKKFKFESGNFKILEYRYFLYEMTSYNTNMMMLPWTQVYSCNFAVPRKSLEAAGGFDENFKGWGVEDIELGYSLCKSGFSVTVNSKLEVLHQYHGPRNDLIIRKEKINGYDRNLDYFLSKHPDAIRMSRKYVFKFLKGEISDDKMFMDMTDNYIPIDLNPGDDPEEIKGKVLKILSEGNFIPIINDYAENTDLDVWLQLPRNIPLTVKYYPMSKRLEREKMVEFLRSEKKRQKNADLSRQVTE